MSLAYFVPSTPSIRAWTSEASKAPRAQNLWRHSHAGPRECWPYTVTNPRRNASLLVCLTCLSFISFLMTISWGNRDERGRFCSQSYGGHRQGNLLVKWHQPQVSCGSPREGLVTHGVAGGGGMTWGGFLAREPLEWQLQAWLPILLGLWVQMYQHTCR